MWPASRHRVLFYADTTFLFVDIFPPYEGLPAFDIRAITDYVNMLADSGVDTLLINANGQVPWYPSEKLRSAIDGYERGDHTFLYGHLPAVGENFTSEARESVSKRLAIMLDRYVDLRDAGIDWVQAMIDTCRKRGMSPWVSVRMNDAHGGNNWNESFMNSEPLRDPACRLQGLSGHTPGLLHPERQLMNYGCAPVRDYMYTMIEELLTRYDFEGMELDWVRTAHCCEPPASQADTNTMTKWHASIRQLANEKAKAKSTKSDDGFTLGMRVPARVRGMRTIGIDVFEIARQGAIDFIGPSNFWQTTWDVPIDDLCAKLPAEVAVLGVVDDAPNWMDAQTKDGQSKGTRMLSASPELLRGNAAGKLAMGCAAIETYNFFGSDERGPRNPKRNPFTDKRQGAYATLAELGSLDTLRGKPKQYTLASMNGGYMYPFFEASEQLPVVIPAGQRKALRLSMASEPADANLKLVLQVVFKSEKQTTPVNEMGVSFNGTWPEFELEATDKLLVPTGVFTHHIPEHQAYNLELCPSLIENGWNEILVLNAHDSYSVELVSVELAITAKEA